MNKAPAKLKSDFWNPTFWIAIIPMFALLIWFDEYWESRLPDYKFNPPTSMIFVAALLACTDLKSRFGKGFAYAAQLALQSWLLQRRPF